MYFLKMFIGKIFIAKYQVEFTGMTTLDERQKHLEELATAMYWEQYQKIKITGTEPQFFVDRVQSRLNDLTYFEEEKLVQPYLKTEE